MKDPTICADEVIGIRWSGMNIGPVWRKSTGRLTTAPSRITAALQAFVDRQSFASNSISLPSASKNSLNASAGTMMVSRRLPT